MYILIITNRLKYANYDGLQSGDNRHFLKIIETELSEPLKSISGDDISQFYKICNFSSLRYVVLPVDLLGTSGTGLSATEPFRTLSRAFLKICLKKNDIESVLF